MVDKRTFAEKMINKKMKGDQVVLGDDSMSLHDEYFKLLSYFEVLTVLLNNSIPLVIGVLIEVTTETLLAFAMIRDSNAHHAFQATTAFGMCMVFAHLFN